MADVMPKRIWNVRLNVDSFNAGFAGLENDQERLSFLAGFHGGLNGVSNNGKSTPFLAGWDVANECLTEAKAFSDKQRDRVNKRYQNVTTVEPRNNHGNTTALPISTIQQSNNPTIEKSTNDSARDEMDILSGSDSEIADADKWHMERSQSYVKTLVAAGCKIGPNSWPRWREMAKELTITLLVKASKLVSAEDRFADKVEVQARRMLREAPQVQAPAPLRPKPTQEEKEAMAKKLAEAKAYIPKQAEETAKGWTK
jgi:hypothetical protein